MRKRSATDRVESVLKQGPARGLTVSEIAARAGVSASAATRAVKALGVRAVGISKGDRGRPAVVYATARSR